MTALASHYLSFVCNPLVFSLSVPDRLCWVICAHIDPTNVHTFPGEAIFLGTQNAESSSPLKAFPLGILYPTTVLHGHHCLSLSYSQTHIYSLHTCPEMAYLLCCLGVFFLYHFLRHSSRSAISES